MCWFNFLQEVFVFKTVFFTILFTFWPLTTQSCEDIGIFFAVVGSPLSFRKLFGMRKWFIALFYLNALLSQFNQIPRTFCEWSICFLDLQPESWICRSFQQMQTTDNLYRYCKEGLEFEVSKTDTVGKILMGFGLIRPVGLHLPV